MADSVVRRNTSQHVRLGEGPAGSDQEAGSIDQAAVTKVLESGEPFKGTRGDYTFSDTEHAAVTTELLSAYAYQAASDTKITFERAPS